MLVNGPMVGAPVLVLGICLPAIKRFVKWGAVKKGN